MRNGAIGIAAAMLLAACSGDALNSPTAMQTSSGSSFATGSTADKPKFNPFADASTTAAPVREVIANPTVPEIMQPASDLPEIAIGRADAPVTIIKYESLTCPFCRQFQAEVFPVLKRDYIDTGKVRFILREFPIGMQSGAATIAMRCAPPAKQFALYDKFMSQQAAWVSQEVRRDPIFKIASQVGMNRADFDACYENRSMIASLNQIKERGRTLGIIGTPNFFVQGKLIKSTLDMAKLRELVDPILAGSQTR
ncbi:MAG: DsbA family protein [Hyphomicrobiaceae bacterium]